MLRILPKRKKYFSNESEKMIETFQPCHVSFKTAKSGQSILQNLTRNTVPILYNKFSLVSQHLKMENIYTYFF